MGLLHILDALVQRRYVVGWNAVNGELLRINRLPPADTSSPDTAEVLLKALEWQKVFDFCERLWSYLAKDLLDYDYNGNESGVLATKADVQEYIASELVNLFVEENLAFEFSEGMVLRRGRRHTIQKIGSAELVLGDARLSKARLHFNKALSCFRHVSAPDFENTVKEAVCSVEATARVLFPSGGSTLGEIVKSIEGSGVGQIPKPIVRTFEGLYGFRSAGEGVGHGGATGGAVNWLNML